MIEYLTRFRANSTRILDLVGIEYINTDVTSTVDDSFGGKMLSFNGTSSFIQAILPNTIESNDFTLNLWYQLKNNIANNIILYTGDFKIYDDGTNIIFDIKGNQLTLLASDTSLHQITITRASNVITAYIDGTQLGNTITYSDALSDKNLYLATDSGKSQFTECDLNDICLVNGYAATDIKTKSYFSAYKFCKVSVNWNKLSDDAKTSLFIGSDGGTADIDELESIGKPFKTLIYTKKKP